MVQVAASGPLAVPAVPRHRIPDAGQWVRNRHRAVAADPLARPVKPADAAQARNFKVLLQAEFARLNELANRMGGPLERLSAADFGGSQAHREFMEINGCMDEVRHLLEALRDRFGIPD